MYCYICKEVAIFACENFATGNDNSQNIDCNSVRFVACDNFANGDANTQNINCLFVSGGCLNNATGDGNTQNIVCVSSTQCTNQSDSPDGHNSQKTVCVKSDTCQNDGTDTRVISVGSNCKSSDPGTKTICVNNRPPIIH